MTEGWFVNIRTFAGHNKCVDDNLCAIIKVAKLRLPYDQIVWIVDGHAVLVREHSFLRQNTVGNFQFATLAMLHRIQWDVHFIGLLINEHGVPLRKCPTAHIFATNSHIMALIHETAESHCLCCCPIDALAIFQFCQPSVDVRFQYMRMNCLQIEVFL